MEDRGRSLWAALELLDRQLLDCDGTPVAKVDDLEFEEAEAGELPVLTNILFGQAALGRRFNRRLGRGVEMLRRVMVPVAEPGPARIPWGAVKAIGPHLTLSLARSDISDATRVDDWLTRHVLSHIPGSGIKPGGESQ